MRCSFFLSIHLPSAGHAILSSLYFDPEAMPVVSLGGENAVDAARLNPDWLRARFARPPVWTPETTDEHRMRRSDAAPTPAAVLVPLVVRENGLGLMLTQRTAHLTDHAGQISFPGGRSEPEDASAIETALRETEEEVGLARQHVEVLGHLPDYVTITGYAVTPVVGLVHPPFTLAPDANEVAEVFEVPLEFILNGAHHQRRSVPLPGGEATRTFYAMPYERFFIWGATAGMLRNLFHFLRAD